MMTVDIFSISDVFRSSLKHALFSHRDSAELPVLAMTGNHSQLIGPGHCHVRVSQHHHRIQALGKCEL